MASLQCRSGRTLMLGWTTSFKWSHPVATFPVTNGGGSYTIKCVKCNTLPAKTPETTLVSPVKSFCMLKAAQKSQVTKTARDTGEVIFVGPEPVPARAAISLGNSFVQP
eukprot:6214063-Pleurochrysis_carterae.AAC.1